MKTSLFYLIMLFALSIPVAFAQPRPESAVEQKKIEQQRLEPTVLPAFRGFTDTCDGKFVWRLSQGIYSLWGTWVPDADGKPIPCKIEEKKK